jgi:hypothetical protein
MYRVCVSGCDYLEHLDIPPDPKEETYTCPHCHQFTVLYTDNYFLNKRLDQIERALGNKGEDDNEPGGPYGPSGKVSNSDAGELYE